jgi:hypothetical protein
VQDPILEPLKEKDTFITYGLSPTAPPGGRGFFSNNIFYPLLSWEKGAGGRGKKMMHRRPIPEVKRNTLFLLRILISVIFFLCSIQSSRSQSINYPEVFGEDWKKAETFEKENRVWIKPLIDKNHISYPLAMSVVFPELVRYSALRDKMEISMLKTLYVNLGEDYADFSIGVFQMKPSFAEKIRDESSAYLGSRSGIRFKTVSDYEDIKDFRKSIIKDLEDPESQVIYLISFIRICEKKFNLNRLDEIKLLKFLATAYNFGIDKTGIQIAKMTDKKFFSAKLISSEKYPYADVSLFWYNQFLSAK